MSGLPTPSRSRTKTSDLSEIFRGSSTSRQNAKTISPTSGSPQATSTHDRPISTPKPRRSMLPFLGRKKAAEQVAPPALPSRSSSNASGIPGSSTLPRSFRNAKTAVIVSPPDEPSAHDPNLPSTLPPLNVSSPSLGSKFAAHFSPLRSPSKSQKVRHSAALKPAMLHSQSTSSLSPPTITSRGTSFESQSSAHSRSSTPRPSHQQTSVVTYYPDAEDYTDLFTLPNPPSKASKTASNLRPLKLQASFKSPQSLELSPNSPTPPTSPRMQFPVPPSTIGRPPRSSTERPNARRSRDTTGGDSASTRRSSGSIKPPPKGHRPPSVNQELEIGSTVTIVRPSMDERDRLRAVSEGDSPRTAAFKQSMVPMLPKSSSMRRPASFQPGIPSKAPTAPPSAPLPSPPSDPPTSPPSQPLPSTPPGPSDTFIQSIAFRPALRTSNITSRPRASTLSGMPPTPSSQSAPIFAPTSSGPAPASLQNPHHIRCGKFDGDFISRASPSELRDALSVAKMKYDRLKDHLCDVTKKHDEEKAEMIKTIEALQRDARKKAREIEGLRWLVIHNGAVGDIDAAANLARRADDEPHGDSTIAILDNTRASSPSKLKRSRTVPDALLSSPGIQNYAVGIPTSYSSGSRSPSGLGFDFLQPSTSSSTLELPVTDYSMASSATSSRSSLSLPGLTPSTTSSLSAIPEQPSGDLVITRADRQRMKEERRASRALRRISASSITSSSSVVNVLHVTSDDDKAFDPPSMDVVLEKLRPFGST
ncbi:hypothetical protein BJ138DRAFT_1140762 [Hygrophoropsis aurantiaca]|uniref:Uncharacterized protein n=1 Tax=Hygrophoropsis aurantiaca TaxID=72124 RepID=A0ACB8ARZ3_9AGAM|nr:hypothetical protein BJ138DRAFT_1140762 [Hygrophoropsis aurantiaca]